MGHDKLYGICQNKCMVEITSKADQETKDSSQDSKITTLESDVSSLETTVAKKQDTITAGTGLSKNGATINHSNSVTAATTAKGSATAVPCIKYDAQGHITACTTATIYPPTSAGTKGQYWVSDGSGAGAWKTLDTAPTADSTKAVTSGAVYTALAGKAASSHTHDDMYYTESEMDTKLSAKADASALDAKQDIITGGATTITSSNLTASRALVSNTDGKVAVSAVTSTELGYLDGVTSAIQTQLNAKESKANAITGLSVSGKVITYTKGDGTTGTITTQDTNTTYSAGTGLALSGTKFNHSNSVTANTAGVGSSTNVPIIKYDAQGHITAVSTATIYPPTSAGTAGQYWKSDGSGTGAWQTMDDEPTEDSTSAVTSGGVKTALDAKQNTLTAGTNVTISGTTISATDTKYSAGTGLALSGTKFNHSNSVTAQTSYVGSATKVPMIKYDAQGHITAMTTATIYPPTSAGTAGQVWVSDGSGAGAWKTLDTAPTADSTNAITSGAVKTALDSKISNNGAATINALTVTGGTTLSNNAFIEMVGAVPFIDMHYGSGTSDYNARIVNDQDGRLNLIVINDAGTSSLELHIKAGNGVTVTDSPIGISNVRNTMISTSAPSGGKNGDIWLQYE